MIEFWQGPPTPPDATEGRPAALGGASPWALFCPPAIAADFSSAALLWFCSTAPEDVQYADGSLLKNADRALLARLGVG